MKLLNISIVFSLLVLSAFLASCGDSDTGDLKLNLKLPIPVIGHGCEMLRPGHGISDEYSYDQCFVPGDKITVSVYKKSLPSDDYSYVQQEVVLVDADSMWGGKHPYIRTLTDGSYYKFFVVVTNKNQKVKMTGGVEGIQYDSSADEDISIFLSSAADFSRVTSNVSEKGSVETYVKEYGTKGMAAAALSDGRVFYAGGYDVAADMPLRNAEIFSPASMSTTGVAKLPNGPLWDHAMATLRDGSESGKVIIAFGRSLNDSLSGSILAYDPEADTYRSLQQLDARTGARAVQTPDGSVFIFGGCDSAKAYGDVFKIDAKTHQISAFQTLHVPRCYQSVSDLSYVDENGLHPRFLVVGGLKKDAFDTPEDYVAGEGFAELVTDAGATPITLKPVSDFDIPKRLAFQSSVGMTWLLDDSSRISVASLVGGIIYAEGNNKVLTSPALYSIYQVGKGDWAINRNSAPLSCAYPSMAPVPSIFESRLAAVNCGPHLDIDSEDIPEKLVARTEYGSPQMFVLQINVSAHNGVPVVSSAARISINGSGFMDQDSSQYTYIDGPTVVNGAGQAYLLGSHYIYQISGYAPQ